MTENSSQSRRSYALVACAAMLWGTWSIFLRPARVDPQWVGVLVFAAMATFGLPLLARPGARPAGRPARTRRDWLGMAALALGDAGNAWFFFNAMARTTVGVAVLSHYLAPALVSLMAPWIVGTAPQRGALPRAAVGTLGLVLVLEPWRIGSGPGQPVVGALFGAASAVFYASNVCFTKRITASFTAEEQLVYHAAMALPVALVLALAGRAPLPDLRGVGLVVLAGALVGVTAAVLFVRGVARVPAEHASVLTLLEPVTAVLVGAIVFREHLGPLALVGGTVVLATGIAAARA